MAVAHNFRGALNGFNREDVVRYIEYMNSRHNSQITQLTSENEDLRKELEKQTLLAANTEKIDALEEELSQSRSQSSVLEAQLSAVIAERDAAIAEIQSLQAQLAQQPSQTLAELELEAYRRAERKERHAQERAEQIYQQATGTLAQATTQVDTAAERFRQVADRINKQLGELQSAVEISKSALVDAATTMYSIRPENMDD